MTLAQLIGQVKRHGHAVVCDNGKPTVRPVKGGATLPDDVLAMLKERRQEIIAWMNPPPEPSFIDRHGLMIPDTYAERALMIEACESFEAWNHRVKEQKNGAATHETSGTARRTAKNVRRGKNEKAGQSGGDSGDGGGRGVPDLYAGHGD